MIKWNDFKKLILPKLEKILLASGGEFGWKTTAVFSDSDSNSDSAIYSAIWKGEIDFFDPEIKQTLRQMNPQFYSQLRKFKQNDNQELQTILEELIRKIIDHFTYIFVIEQTKMFADGAGEPSFGDWIEDAPCREDYSNNKRGEEEFQNDWDKWSDEWTKEKDEWREEYEKIIQDYNKAKQNFPTAWKQLSLKQLYNQGKGKLNETTN